MIVPETETNHYRYIIDKDYPNKNIRDILLSYGFSNRLISQVKRDGQLLLNNEPVFFIEKVKKGDQIDVYFPEERYGAKPVKGDIDIIYEDSEVLIVNKPSFLVVHPTKDYQENTLANYIAHYFHETGQKVKVRFVNRLDRDTTGVVIIAKNRFVHHYIQSRMKTDEVKKTYLAFLDAIPDKDEDLIDLPIYRPLQESIERIVDERGKPSQTQYKIIEKYDHNALVECELLTGRTHQIRVHMKAIGAPLIGDPLYNPESGIEFPRQALHAKGIEITLPKTGKQKFEAPLTEDLMELRKRLKEKENE